MYCGKCGQKLNDDALFCTECGAPVEPAANTEAGAPEGAAGQAAFATEHAAGDAAGEAAAECADTSAGTSAKEAVSFPAAMEKTKTRSRGRIMAVVVVALVVAAIAGTAIAAYIISTANADVPEEQVRDDFEYDTAYLEDGLTPSQYVDSSHYTLNEFRITAQEDERISSSGDTHHRVDFEGTMSNESFKTDFSGHVYYVKADSDADDYGADDGTNTDAGTDANASNDTDKTWKLESPHDKNKGFEITEFTTTPTGGVVEFSQNLYQDSSAYYRGGKITSTDPVENSDGVYTVTVTQDIEYDFWFGTDVGVNTQTFYFDQKDGWKPEDKVYLEEGETVWALPGTTFELTSDPIGLGDGTMTSTLTFVDSGDEDMISADYTIHYVPAATDGNTAMEVQEFREVTLDGRASGAPEHEFGKEDLSFLLVDTGTDKEGNGAAAGDTADSGAAAGETASDEDTVSFNCRLGSSSSTSTAGGAGTKKTLAVSIYTDEVYCHQSSIGGWGVNYDWRINSSENYFAGTCTYTEVG